jgi:Asp-tRNA(Asn)/Glu-tRNA(Gln) amidotransferase A subunit family amidase
MWRCTTRDETQDATVSLNVADDSLTWLAAWELRELMVAREVSPVEVTRHFLDRIASLDPALHAFITVSAERALADAKAREAQLMAGEPLGQLFGVPVSVKDLYWTAGVRTTGGSLLYADHVPSEDAICVARARRAGAVLIGKTNTPEFGLFIRTMNRVAPECVNPWDPARTAGGSSGGAAVSVAAGMSPVALGGDSAGSIRIPAAFCGVFGLQPSNGRVPRHGGFGGSLFFSAVGPLSRDVRDAASVLQVLAGPDPRDPTCLEDTPPDYRSNLDGGVAALRMAWMPDWGASTRSGGDVVSLAGDTARIFEQAGALVDTPNAVIDVDAIWESFLVISDADRYATLGAMLYEDPARRGLLSPYARERFARGRQLTAAEYSLALRARFRFIREVERLFQNYDLILTPTIAQLAPSLQALPTTYAAQALIAYVPYTFFVNFSGAAAASVPCGLVEGMPVALQIIAPRNHEHWILRASRTLELLRPWAHRRPLVR